MRTHEYRDANNPDELVVGNKWKSNWPTSKSNKELSEWRFDQTMTERESGSIAHNHQTPALP